LSRRNREKAKHTPRRRDEMSDMIYRCGNKRCLDYGKEFQAMNFHALMAATGSHVTCPKCGEVAWYVRDVEEPIGIGPAPNQTNEERNRAEGRHERE
jgi:hypothetical protein